MNIPIYTGRTHALVMAVAFSLLGFDCCFGQSGGSAQTMPATNTVVSTNTEAATTNAVAADAPRTNTAIVPRLAPNFNRRHTNFVEIAKKGDIDVLFMGDSITDWWKTPAPTGGSNVFEKYFGTMKLANFGIAGDTTQGVLWRLQNGEGQGYKPKAIMLMIGTNNTGRNSAPEIIEGITAVVTELRKDFPDARILLLAVFPRNTAGTPVRAKIDEINVGIAKLNDLNHIFYLDFNSKFLDAEGNFLEGVFRADRLHPVEAGYEIWAEAVKDPLANLMKLAASAN